MTDKQIIIDGINVSECEYLYIDSKYNDKCCSASIGGNCLCKPSEMICIKYVECLKEQLKRKEQECEELKVEAERWKSAFTLDTKMLDNAEARTNKLEQQLDKLKAENKKFKQTLTNIKEIAKENIRIADLEGLNGVYRRGLAEQILQKISEVKL